ncbi:hypothetical protein MNBD_GAMMA12-2496 [hydrothermal vent metagenome]|uniref:PD-(D/E)XK endonuclease-like domain-containing protein n=1 Tax=hydrothermal vent metagenome TaxID=652676 RepID=A0A3B0YKQ5_9ZZZZ
MTEPIIILEYAEDPLRWAAESLLKRFKSQLPNLGDLLIFVEEPTIAPVMRKQLLKSAQQYHFSSLLGPTICTLQDYALLLAPTQSIQISRAASELHLKKELESFTHLFGESDPWRLATTLLDLFDELTYQGISPGNNIDSFITRISDAWHIDNTRINQHSDEARIIYTLWHAWHEQLDAMQMQDEPMAIQKALQHLSGTTVKADFIYLLGITELKGIEGDCIRQLLEQGNTQLIIQSAKAAKLNADHESHTIPTCWQRLNQQINSDESNVQQIVANNSNKASSAFFEAVFNYQQEPLPIRAENFAELYPESPVQNKMQCVSANGIEQEAMLVKKQIAQWLDEGYRNIAIVSEDRKLSRRVRALLERDDIHVYDLAGWTLATTRVATVIEAWLQCIETNFSHYPLLELLKSSYSNLHTDPVEYEHAIYRFELDIVHHEQVASDLKRYRKHIEYRHQRLSWNEPQTKTITDILILLEKTAQPLQKAFRSNSRKSYLTADRYIAILMNNLQQLNLIQQLEQDDAGVTMLNLLEQLKHCTDQHPLPLSWGDFRDWLGQQFENSHFRPKVDSRDIQLLSLAQTRLMSFDRLVIAGNEYSHIPGSPDSTPYFNQQVRKELGLAVRQDHLSIKLHDYRRLIESALCNAQSSECKLLLTWRHQDQDEDIMPTPWLQAMQSFHQQAWGSNLLNDEFYQQMLDELKPKKQSPHTQDMPAASISAANINITLVPEFLSASSHQQLIDCPYKFFCSSILKLQAVEEIQEALSAADYGHKVHACLEAFHAPVAGFPEPFSLNFTDANRALAITHLEALSGKVFSKDIEANFQHRAWLQRWTAIIPNYIDWQISRTGFFKLQQTEQLATRAITQHTSLKGRLDRIDVTLAPVADGKNLNVIDYKTGSTNLSSKDITAGEQTQLLTYALLDDRIDSVQYLQLTPSKPSKTQAEFKSEQLASLKQSNLDRLNIILEQLGNGQDMPAWGSPKACAHCKMTGICRKQVVGESQENEA